MHHQPTSVISHWLNTSIGYIIYCSRFHSSGHFLKKNLGEAVWNLLSNKISELWRKNKIKVTFRINSQLLLVEKNNIRLICRGLQFLNLWCFSLLNYIYLVSTWMLASFIAYQKNLFKNSIRELWSWACRQN